jgi:2-polyprenyl-6-methoxyphenol hydroxylase-like FAD-dependent oxidoreductase
MDIFGDNMKNLKKTNVIIVGNGPSGMTTALTLAKFGIASTIIERRPSLYMEPRAHALNSRTLEIFSALGIDLDDFKALATPNEESCWVRWVDKLNGDEYGKLPYEQMEDKGDLPSPHPLFNISQPNCEKVLQKYVDDEALITTLRPFDWLQCEQIDEGVVSTIRDKNGQQSKILSRFLIGADGAGSPVRASQNIAMQGMGIVQNFIMIHFKADLSALVKDKPAILYWVMEQSCSGTLIAYDIYDNWVFMYPYDDTEKQKSDFTPEYCRQLVLQAIGQSNVDIEILSNGGWGLGSQIAENYRHKNVFLVGDSAHRYPPSGGLGLNTGVGDAQNVAWKIAAVLNQWAWPGLLDSYETERKQVAINNANFSVENAGKLLSIMVATESLMPQGFQNSLTELRKHPEKWADIQQGIEDQRDHFDGMALHIGQHYGRTTPPDLHAQSFQYNDVGARFPHTWLEVNQQKTSSLELLCAKQVTLIASSEIDVSDVACDVPLITMIAGKHFNANDASLKTMGLQDASAILVRPDGHISARFEESMPTISNIQDALLKASAKFLAFE